MKSILDKSFRYVPADKQGPGYLKAKFDRIRTQLRKQEQERAEKVKPLQHRKMA